MLEGPKKSGLRRLRMQTWNDLLGQVLLLGSPRPFWAYADEDFVGWIAELAFLEVGRSYTQGL